MISWTFYEFIIWIVAGCKIKMLWGFFIGKHLVPILVLFQDAFRFVGMMSIIAIAGTVFSIYDLLVAGDPVFDAIVTGLDVITICVPPALPSALTIGIHYAVSRLIYHDCVPRNYSSLKRPIKWVINLIRIFIFSESRGISCTDGHRRLKIWSEEFFHFIENFSYAALKRGFSVCQKVSKSLYLFIDSN